MSRRRTSWAVRTQREALAQQRLRHQAHRTQLRVLQAAERERLRQDKSRAKEYAEARVAEALEQTNDVGAQVEEISGLLGAFLRLSGRLDLQSLKTPPPNLPFDPGPLGVANPPPSDRTMLEEVHPLLLTERP